jgi:hypothetical protein
VTKSLWRITPPATAPPAPSRRPCTQDIHARRALAPPGPGFAVALRAFRKSRCVGQGPARGHRSAQRQPKRAAASQSTARASAPYWHRICPSPGIGGRPGMLLSPASEHLPRGSRGACPSSGAGASWAPAERLASRAPSGSPALSSRRRHGGPPAKYGTAHQDGCASQTVAHNACGGHRRIDLCGAAVRLRPRCDEQRGGRRRRRRMAHRERRRFCVRRQRCYCVSSRRPSPIPTRATNRPAAGWC